MDKKNFLINFPAGFVAGELFTGLMYVMVDSNFLRFTSDEKANIFVGIATIFGGAMAVGGALETIQAQQRAEQKLRRERLAAAKSTLPFALREIAEIAKNRICYLVDADEKRKELLWDLSRESIETISLCIELSDGESTNTLEELPLIYQILSSRFSHLNVAHPISLQNGTTNAPSLSQINIRERGRAIIQWLSFSEVALQLFDYARGREPRYPRADVHTSFVAALDLLSCSGSLLRGDTTLEGLFDEVRRDPMNVDMTFNNPQWRYRDFEIR